MDGYGIAFAVLLGAMAVVLANVQAFASDAVRRECAGCARAAAPAPRARPRPSRRPGRTLREACAAPAPR